MLEECWLPDCTQPRLRVVGLFPFEVYVEPDVEATGTFSFCFPFVFLLGEFQ